MIKLLITSGCSFSQVPSGDLAWPIPLSKILNVDVETHGRGACGNGIISRTIIHAVTNALKTYKPEELLVGIMWSGTERTEFYKPQPDIEFNKFYGGTFYSNPQFVVGHPNYILVTEGWEDELSKMWYKNFYSKEHGIIIAYEHILRTEWFLKMHNIKYFMTGYSYDSYPVPGFKTEEDLEVKFIMEQVDYDNWLSVRNMDDWCRKLGLPYRHKDDFHPSSAMHKRFVDEVIVPHLKMKGIL